MLADVAPAVALAEAATAATAPQVSSLVVTRCRPSRDLADGDFRDELGLGAVFTRESVRDVDI